MNPDDPLARQELHALRAEQRDLRARLDRLDARLARWETGDADPAVSEPAARGGRAGETPAPVAFPSVALPTLANPPTTGQVPPPLPPTTRTGSIAAAVPPPPPHASLEMRIGTTWLVRAGVVLVLTSLAFLGSYLYYHVVPHLGPLAKVALLYVGAGALTGLGAWLERRQPAATSVAPANARLRDYAQVIFAGGLAAIYYVTYAAHYYETLRVIPSALLAGSLLLAWTAFMVWLAHRRDSETLATIAILLAYYTAAINDGVAGFTLVSTLAPSAGVVFLLRRHLWRVFPFASLLATYGSYAFWTYYSSAPGWRGADFPAVHAHHAAGGFWIEVAFLAIYWTLFTYAVFTADPRVFADQRRVGFASLNNGAFYALVTWLVLGEGSGGFWKWSLGLGLVLIALAEASRRVPRLAAVAPRLADTYDFQGASLLTVAFVAYFDGWQLAVVLAVETVALLMVACRRQRRWLLAGSFVTALLACAWAQLALNEKRGPWLSVLAVGALLIGAATLAQRRREGNNPPRDSAAPDLPRPGAGWLRLLAAATWGYSLLGSLIFLGLIQTYGGDRSYVPFLVGVAALWTASVYVLRVKPLPLLAQGFLGVAAILWLSDSDWLLGGEGTGRPLADTLCLLVAAVALGQWWHRLPGNVRWTSGRLSRFLGGTDAIVAVGVSWLELSSRVARAGTAAFTLAAGWSGFAALVFVAGLALHQRLYRWLGLVIMAATLVRLVVFDIMQLDSLGKAVGFFALSVVLLGVGFLYNRFQDRWRDVL